MSKPCLHLDADASIRALQKELIARGHTVSRTPAEWMPADASDEMQLLGATLRACCIFTFNIADFATLAKRYPRHAGIIVAVQRDWTLSSLIRTLDRLLTETDAEKWVGQLRWLNE